MHSVNDPIHDCESPNINYRHFGSLSTGLHRFTTHYTLYTRTIKNVIYAYCYSVTNGNTLARIGLSRNDRGASIGLTHYHKDNLHIGLYLGLLRKYMY